MDIDESDIETIEVLLDLCELWEKYEEFASKVKKLKKKKKNRRINKQRDVHGYYKVTFLEIKRLDSAQFFTHTRMSKTMFELLLAMCTPNLEKKSIRKAIEPESRLALTLLYLSQGCSFQSLAWSWKLGKETVRSIIYEVCDVLWKVLSPIYVSEPTLAELSKIADDFWEIWNMPNCIGAIDGKHIALTKPPNTGSEFFNYKKFYSIVLLATCDARYTFTYIDVGAYGSQSDGGIFNISSFGKRILENKLEIPEPKKLPNSDIILPHFFVADAAFPLHVNIMKPYPGVGLSAQKEKYNKRISRARRIIENSFGILVVRWRILLTTLNLCPANAEKIVLACIALHNFLRLHKESQNSYLPTNFVDWFDEGGNIHEGLWRREIDRNLQSFVPNRNANTFARNQSTNIRNKLCAFINNQNLQTEI